MDDEVQSCSGASGAVRERPAFDRGLGGSSAEGNGLGLGVSLWAAECEAFDLTGAGGEVLFEAFAGGDMGVTLVKPLWGRVCGRMADMARRAALGCWTWGRPQMVVSRRGPSGVCVFVRARAVGARAGVCRAYDEAFGRRGGEAARCGR